jgi:hypothetical protein
MRYFLETDKVIWTPSKVGFIMDQYKSTLNFPSNLYRKIEKSCASHHIFIAFWALLYEIPDCADSLLRLSEGEHCNIFATSASLASVKMAGLLDLFLSETDPHSRNWLIILVIVALLETAESRYFR